MNHHTFDYAKQGYLNLLLKQSKDHGDNVDMVKARTDFLNTDSYQFLKNRIAEIFLENKTNVLADLGCGEGYYTKDIQVVEKYGFDLSKDALKHASKTDSSTQYVVASIFHLPLESDSCDGALTCFAPAATEELERILKKDGIFVFVTPGPKHLFEMKEVLYEKPYENVMEDLGISLELVSDEMIENTFLSDPTTSCNLFLMTPYAYKTSITGKDKLVKAGTIKMTAQFRIRVYKKK